MPTPTPLAGFLGDILVTSPPSVNLSPLPTVLTDSGDHQTFTNPTAGQRLWDNTATFTVQTTINGGTTWTTATPGTYTIRYLDGQVTLNAALTGTPGCQITAGKYTPYGSMGNTTEWVAAWSAKSVTTTTLKGVGGVPWEDYIVTTLGGPVTLKKWWIDGTFSGLLIARTPLVLSCVAADGHRYDAQGYLTQDSVKLAVAGAIESDLTFMATNAVLYV